MLKSSGGGSYYEVGGAGPKNFNTKTLVTIATHYK